MRFLAIVIAIPLGQGLLHGAGEYEAKIEAATTIEQKVAIAETAFATIDNFVLHELFMSYWSIDALETIATHYQKTVDSHGLEGLLPHYETIVRICSMEMGDYRYYFEPLKRDLEALQESISDESNGLKVLSIDSERKHALWSSELISAFIEYWVNAGLIRSTEDEALLQKDWSLADIDYWEILFSNHKLSPQQLSIAMESRIHFPDWNPQVHAFFMTSQLLEADLPGLLFPIAFRESSISVGGPRL